MCDHEALVSISERMGIAEERLKGLEHRDLHKWARELHTADHKG